MSSSSSASALLSGGVPDGIRKPVRYQFEGRTRPGSRSSASAWPAHGPTRSSFRASTSLARTSSELAGAPGAIFVGSAMGQLLLPPAAAETVSLDSVGESRRRRDSLRPALDHTDPHDLAATLIVSNPFEMRP